MGIFSRAHHSAATATATATATTTTAVLILILTLTLTLTLSAAYQPNKTISFDTFSPGFDNISFLGEASASQGALQLTPDTNNIDFSLVNKSGRVLYKTPFLLWDDSHIASFNTSFLINVDRLNSTPAEGLAFLITSDLSDPPPGSYGGYLGLTNATIDGHADNHFVAVELDTFQQSYDPDDNHIGLDLNGVVSNITTSLTPLGIQISPVNTPDYTIWVDYDGAAMLIRVYIALNRNPKPTSPVLSASLDLKKYLLQTSYFGFAGSTGTNIELNCVKAWNLTVEDLSREDKGMPGWKLAVAICIPAVAVVAVMGFLIRSYLTRRRVAQDELSVLSTLKSLPGMPREFQFKELKRATGNFDERNKLGQGGFGVVYKGVIAGDTETSEVAVKKFSRDRMSSQGDFLAELSIINRLRHKHLVRLIGWCHKNGMLLLVYEYMPNGSLDQHLFDGPERPLLSWERRYNIAAGVASALHYLHDEYDQKVVHRDLKASNVMLDAAFNARLGDFGLARALDTDKTSYAEIELGGVPGTLGYIAPECFHTGKATRESDVYGFGAVVLEVACGRRPRCEISGFHYLADWVWKLHREGRIVDAVDPRLSGEYVAEEAERLLLLGLACCHPLPKERPKAQAIVQILSGSVPPPKVPPFKPAFVWPSWTPGGDEGDDEGAASALTSTVLTSSYYASSGGGWTPKFLSREGPMGGGDV